MSDIVTYFESFNFYSYFRWEDFLILMYLYIFFKYLIITTIVELIWPTQYFNRKHSSGYQSYRLRTYTETLLKLRNYTTLYSVFNSFLIKYRFINHQ